MIFGHARTLPASVGLLCLVIVTGARAAEEEPYRDLPYTPSLDVAAMDRTAKPCDDLYRFACGGWQARNPIPEDKPRWSVYGKSYVDNQRYLWGLLEQHAAGGAERNPTQRLIGDHFAACMDTAAVEKAGLAPLNPLLERVAGLESVNQLGALIGALQLQTQSDRFFFGVGPEQDARESERIIPAIYPGGLGLPDRDYYVHDDDKSRSIRERYREYVASMLVLAGDDAESAAEAAKSVLRIETRLARASLTAVERRDPWKLYHRTVARELPQLASQIDWPALFRAGEVPESPWMNVAEPEQLHAVAAALGTEPLAAIRTYLRWGLLDVYAKQLPKAFVDANFAFYSAFLRGVPEQPPRWNTCVGLVDAQLGEALGREFVERNFPPEVRADVLRMTRQIQDAMRARIEALDWMSPSTRTQALAKLASMRNKIGHPDRWRDYAGLELRRDDYFGNVTRATLFESKRQLAKIGQALDRDEWFMSPATVNAYYNPQMNDINFPAGVLMPPLFDPRLDDAPNYGNTGATIGHELTHGFDDEGRHFDSRGNLRDWWTAGDAKRFETKAQCVRDQYSQYTVVDDLKINGALTSGEDIADIGGLLIAWIAWQEQARLRPPEARDGLSPAQRFFVGFAQWACANERPEDLRVRAVTDPHSPPLYRVNGVVANLPQFSEAFQCKPGDALYRKPAEICTVW